MGAACGCLSSYKLTGRRAKHPRVARFQGCTSALYNWYGTAIIASITACFLASQDAAFTLPALVPSSFCSACAGSSNNQVCLLQRPCAHHQGAGNVSVTKAVSQSLSYFESAFFSCTKGHFTIFLISTRSKHPSLRIVTTPGIRAKAMRHSLDRLRKAFSVLLWLNLCKRDQFVISLIVDRKALRTRTT